MDLKDVIKRPIITEKSTQMTSLGRYTFQVDKRAKKKEIKRAVEKFFGVKVKKVRTIIMRGKKRRVGRLRKETQAADWKKAIVQLAAGEKIDLFATPGSS